MGPDPPCPYVSRGGIKLRHALDTFGIDVHGMVCADLGASTGGFTDCLLQEGARRVYSVDTAYGVLDWKLRRDPRVVVLERTNALHADPPEAVDLVTIDLGWTRQARALPAAALWLKAAGHIISLVKPHYEADRQALEPGGLLEPDAARQVAEGVRDQLPGLGFRVLGWTKSPILGGAAGRGKRRKGAGNPEWLLLLALS